MIRLQFCVSIIITESYNGLGWKAPLSSYSPSLLHWVGASSTRSVTQSPIQPDLKGFQGWGIFHLSGQLALDASVFHHSHHKKFLRYILSKSTLFQFKTITLLPFVLSQQGLPKGCITVMYTLRFILRNNLPFCLLLETFYIAFFNEGSSSKSQ